ncbi:uncharacterized protein LOC111115542 [Crassostrea virginica]
MATSQGQDVIRCQLCPNPVELHCDLCHVDLCVNCVSKHLKDNSKKHDTVDFPECKSHDKKRCEMYCKDCQVPMCVLCVTTHNKHDISDIKSIIENLKRRIAADVKEMENIIPPKYKQKVGIGNSSKEFDRVMNEIQDQEDNICKVVRAISSQLKDEVAKQKRDLHPTAATDEKELNKAIKNFKEMLISNDAKRILKYQSKNELFGEGQNQVSYLMFRPGNVRQGQIQEMLGSLQMSSNLHGRKKLMSNPVALSTIQTPYGKDKTLFGVLCDGTGKIWISGSDSKIYHIDQGGSILKTVSVSNNVSDLSLSIEKELTFSVFWPDTKVYKYDGDAVRTLVDLGQWCPRGLCHSAKGDLLVSMRSVDKTQSRVVMFSGTAETIVIQNDRHGNPLISVKTNELLLLTENGNGDICVSDYAEEAVVVFNASGELRNKYHGHLNQTNCKPFRPTIIACDSNFQILTSDHSNDFIHLLKSDGSFLGYIKYPCSGGLSINAENNLIVGGMGNGKLRIIKYLH